MALEQRLRQIEGRLELQMRGIKCETQYIDLLDLPKETLIAMLRVLWEANGSYQGLLSRDQLEGIDAESQDMINKLKPEQFYDLLIRERGDIRP